MKLYEFTYTDKQNLPETELLGRVEDFLVKESEIQGWAPDYKFQQCKTPKYSAAGETNYFFEVIGRYLDSDTVTHDEESERLSGADRAPHAAKDADF